MRVFDKTCPACQTTFEAKRRNQLYCTPECRADINNDKLKAKFNNIKTIEKDKVMGDKFKAAYLSAIRIVATEYDPKDKNEIITFEGRKYEKIASDMKPMEELGIRLGEKSVQDNQRVAVFFPKNALLCFMPRFNSFSSFNTGVTYQWIEKIQK
jgi:hypothetical protein